MNSAYLLIGGNLGKRINNLEIARKLIATEVGKILIASSVYETAAWGITDQPDFLNQVLKIETQLSPREVMDAVLSIENRMGRIRTEKNAARIIDIDILFFNNDIIHTSGLVIPHPEIHNRKFVLIPLNEIASSKVHPVLHQTIETLLSTSPDTLEVRRVSKS